MLTQLRSRLTFANIASGLALFVALSAGTVYAASYVVSTNSQVAPNTIAGHHTPSGDNANVIAGTINGTDIQSGSIGSAQLAAPPAWRTVAANPLDPDGFDPCSASPPSTGVFCGTDEGSWFNYGSPFTPAAYYRDLLGTVHLHGLVHPAYCPIDVSEIFVLPTGYRPSHRLVLHADAGSNDQYSDVLQRIDILPSGEVEITNPAVVDPFGGGCFAAGYVSLDGIAFRGGE
jgi:hypothetical protein